MNTAALALIGTVEFGMTIRLTETCSADAAFI
jgi:hypothetical protein